MSELSDRIEAMVKQLEERIPSGDLNDEKIKRAKEIVDRIKSASDPLQEGVVADPYARSKPLHDLRELLLVSRDVLIPREMRKVVAQLRVVAKLAERTG